MMLTTKRNEMAIRRDVSNLCSSLRGSACARLLYQLLDGPGASLDYDNWRIMLDLVTAFRGRYAETVLSCLLDHVGETES